MPTKNFWPLVAAIMLGVLLALLVQYVFVQIAPTLFLFALGLLIAHLFDPVVNRLRKRGWSRAKAVGLVAVVVVVIFGGLLAWLIPALVGEVEQAVASAPAYADKAATLYGKAVDWATAQLGSRGSTSGYVEAIQQQLIGAQNRIAEKVPEALGWLSKQLLHAVGRVVWLAPLVLISFYFMVVIDDFREGLREVLPAAAQPHLQSIERQMGAMLSQYFRGLAATAVTVGAVATVVLFVVSLIFGTRYWLLIGLIAGPLYVVPYLGPALSELGAAFFGYATAAAHPGWAALASGVGLLLVNQAGDVFIMPRIVGRKVGLHPLAIFFGILSGYQLFGLVGTLLATPMMVGVKIMLAHWLPLRGAEPGAEAPAPGSRLDLDWGAALKRGAEYARHWGGKVEHLVRHEHEHGREHAAKGAPEHAPHDEQPPEEQDTRQDRD